MVQTMNIFQGLTE